MITYPLAFPTDLIDEVSFGAETAAGATVSPFSFAEQVQDWGGDRLAAAVRTAEMKGDEGRAFAGFVASLRGRSGTFLIGDPAALLMGSGVGAPEVDGAGQTGTALATRGWTASAMGVLLRGDHFQIGSGGAQRLHIVLADVDADGAGEAAVDIFPSLRESPADGEPLVLTAPKGVFRLTGNVEPWRISGGALYRFTLAAREAL